MKREVDFGKNELGKPKILTEKESVCNIILNLLLMKPGNLPSMPHIGINIQQYLYKVENSFDVDELKNKIYAQAKELLPYVLNDGIQVFTTDQNGKSVLLINFPISIGQEEDTIIYAFSNNASTGTVDFGSIFQSLLPSK